MIAKIMEYLQYPFVRYAFIVGIMISVAAALLGVILVLKRLSFIGDGLSHVAFGAMAVAAVTGLTNRTYIVLPVTVICAILILKTGQSTRIKGDAAIAMISVGALAFGYLFMNVFSVTSNVSGDVCSTLFEATSMLTLTKADVIICTVFSVLVVLFFLFFYNRIFAVTFDEDFSKASGTDTEAFNLVIAVIIAVIIVLAMNLIGSLLISALVIFPAMSAMRVFSNFKSVTLFSAVISVLCTLIGMAASIVLGTPVGATIVCFDVLAFLICWITGKLTGRS